MSSTVDAAYRRATAELSARGPGRMLPDMSRITRLVTLMGDPQDALPVVHVTGTNGKGSVVRMVSTLCAAAGITAGTYTSPHLQSVRERFMIAGRPISRRRFTEVYEAVKPLVTFVDDEILAGGGTAHDQVTYFEFLTAMALWWCADQPVDAAVIEVGMGGAFDATNVVRGDVAVFNAIDRDHPELGDTPVAVAREKAGILKPFGSAVTAAQQPAVMQVLADVAAGHDVPLACADTDFAVVSRVPAVGGQQIAVRVGDRVISDIALPLFGAHQAANAALALAAFAAFMGDGFAGIDDDVLRHGLEAVTVPGRMEIVHRYPTIVVDGAHNPHAARTLVPTLTEAFGDTEIVLVIACFADKDVPNMLHELRDRAAHVVVTTVDNPRAMPADVLASHARHVWQDTPVLVTVSATPEEAIADAQALALDSSVILVTGSLVLVGEVRQQFLGDVDDDDEVVRLPDDDDDDPIDEFPLDTNGL